MHRHQYLHTAGFVGLLSVVVASGACRQAPEPEAVPPPQVRTEALHDADQPISVMGCLTAGEAATTFLLTAARADGAAETATYQLVAVHDMELRDRMRDQVGQMVQVDGTLRAQKAATAQTLATPADTEPDRPAATTGEPMVQTRTDVEINEVVVETITPLGEECGIGM